MIRIFIQSLGVLFVCIAVFSYGQVRVSTFAGNGDYGFTDGTDSAKFDGPAKVTTDKAGNVYIADEYNYAIRKITPAGVVTTVAGAPFGGYLNGHVDSAMFGSVSDLCLDTIGNIYIADMNHNRIRKIDTAGFVSDLTGGVYSPGFGAFGFKDGVLDSAKMGMPAGICYDQTNHCLFVAENFNSCIRKIDLVNNVISTYAAKPVMAGGSIGYLDGPDSVALFNEPTGLTVDDSGYVYVADAANHCVRKIDLQGSVSTFVGIDIAGFIDGQDTSARFDYPTDIDVDYFRNFYVTDKNNASIRGISSLGNVVTYAGPIGTPGFFDGLGNQALFSGPTGIAVDRSGNKFVADSWNHRIRRISFNVEDLEICADDTVLIEPTGGTFHHLYTSELGGLPLVSGSSFVLTNITSDTIFYLSNVEVDESFQREIIQITVNPLPVIDLGADTIYISLGNDTLLDAGNAGSEFLWYPGNEVTQTVNVNIPGIYAVLVTNQWSCTASDSVTILFDIGFDENGKDADAIRVFPNPFTDKLMLDIGKANEMELELTDVNGRIVERRLLSGNAAGRYSLNFEQGRLPESSYFLVFKSGLNHSVISRKLIRRN